VLGYPRGDVKIGFHSANCCTRGAPITLGYRSAHHVRLFKEKEGINPFEQYPFEEKLKSSMVWKTCNY
jgi:hypothetical protein